jgi:7-cyano-7-deazaguanine synthase
MPNQVAPSSSALVLFSGGQDSSVCLAWALERYPRVETVGFDYGQRHAVELEAREKVRAALAGAFPRWAGRLGPDHMLEIKGFGVIGETAMTSDRVIETTERGLPSTFVPGRNLVFLTYAAALADRRGHGALVALADDLGGELLVELILEHSHTCYLGERRVRHDWGYGCGACPACELRAHGWRTWRALEAAG